MNASVGEQDGQLAGKNATAEHNEGAQVDPDKRLITAHADGLVELGECVPWMLLCERAYHGTLLQGEFLGSVTARLYLWAIRGLAHSTSRAPSLPPRYHDPKRISFVFILLDVF
jgi:hypothetical protein